MNSCRPTDLLYTALCVVVVLAALTKKCSIANSNTKFCVLTKEANHCVVLLVLRITPWA